MRRCHGRTACRHRPQKSRARPASRPCAGLARRSGTCARLRTDLYVERDRGQHAVGRRDDARHRARNHNRRKTPQRSSRSARPLRRTALRPDPGERKFAVERGGYPQSTSLGRATLQSGNRRTLRRPRPLCGHRHRPPRVSLAGGSAGADGRFRALARCRAGDAGNGVYGASPARRPPSPQRRQRTHGTAADEPRAAARRLSAGGGAPGGSSGLYRRVAGRAGGSRRGGF